jgi:hypothetical protein
VYGWKNYPASTKLTLFGAPFPSIDGKLFCFCNSVQLSSQRSILNEDNPVIASSVQNKITPNRRKLIEMYLKGKLDTLAQIIPD